MKATLVWTGGKKDCPHEHIESRPEPTGVVIYAKDYRKGKDGPLVKGKPYDVMRDVIFCLDCGAKGRVAP